MKVKCLHNTGEALRPYEYELLEKERLGRFGATGYSVFGGIEIGREYLVMGIIFGQGSLSYLINEGRMIGSYPSPLFEVIDNDLPSIWFFNSLKNTDKNYPYREAIWGYYELVFIENHYEKLIDFDEEAHLIYFSRKKELEHKYPDDSLETAQIISEKWVMCNYCSEVWQIMENTGVIECINCKKIMNNPFYCLP